MVMGLFFFLTSLHCESSWTVIGWLLTNFFSETLKSCLPYKEWVIAHPLPLVEEGHLSCCAIRNVARTHWHVTE